MQQLIARRVSIPAVCFVGIVFLVSVLLMSIPEARGYHANIGFVPFWLILLPSISVVAWICNAVICTKKVK